MGFCPETFDHYIARLTNPEYGIVHPTTHEDVYQIRHGREQAQHHSLLAVAGPSRAGKDSLIGTLIDMYPKYKKVGAATSRPRCEGEAPDAYTWMRPPHETEDEQTYLSALIEEYDLVEYDIHHETVYGLPRQNLDGSHEQTPVINADTWAVRTLHDRPDGKFSLTSVFVCPDSAAELERRMSCLDRHHLGRLATAQMYMEEAPDCVDYILLNRTVPEYQQASTAAAGRVHALMSSLQASKIA